MNYFKKNLDFILKSKNMSKSKLADSIGITRQSVSEYITKDKMPSIDSLIKISEVLNVTIDDLLKKDLSK